MGGWLAVSLTVIGIGLSLSASAHVLLTKRDSRSAVAWIGLIWLSPFVGSLTYLVFGINLIQRKAQRKRRRGATRWRKTYILGSIAEIEAVLPPEVDYLAGLAHLGQRVSGLPLTADNAVEPFDGGDPAFDAMLEAIGRAERTIGLASYIFRADRIGERFIEALKEASARGVSVRVLIDDVGGRQEPPTAVHLLRKAGVPVATFIPTLTPAWTRYFNLRNHRKILVVDGAIGFAGGLNVFDEYSVACRGADARNDVHFRIIGPAVDGLRRAFCEDWEFSTGESLVGPDWFPPLEAAGDVPARGLPDGPDTHIAVHYQILMGAIACARQSVTIMTPYFLPDGTLLAALGIAAMRGVKVRIILPDHNNHIFVEWASRGGLEEVLASGCQVWRTTGTFDHAKLMVVDGLWTLFGSTNWDMRSLRLNFEYSIECYSRGLAERIEAIISRRMDNARRLRLDELRKRSLPVRLRDGIARLFLPYL